MKVKTCTLSRRQSRLFGAGEVRIRRKCAGLSAGLSDIDLTDEKNEARRDGAYFVRDLPRTVSQ
jgi:hypothetical protein